MTDNGINVLAAMIGSSDTEAAAVPTNILKPMIWSWYVSSLNECRKAVIANARLTHAARVRGGEGFWKVANI
jgi:hypothetical protein